MTTDTHKMIKEYTSDISDQVGIFLSKIQLIEGSKVGCLDIHLMNLSSEDHIVSVLVYQADIDKLVSGESCDRLELKIRTALSRLNTLKLIAPP